MLMTKPFDLKALLQRLEEKGLPHLEKDVVMLTEELFGWVIDSCNMKDGMMYKVAVPAIEFVKPFVLQFEDKIDGVVGDADEKAD